MVHTENLFARHRFELIMLILWFYFAIWLGSQMKSGSHLLQRLWCECHVPAAPPQLWGTCGVPVAFLSVPQHKGCVGASVGGGGHSCTHCWTIPGHKASHLISELMGWKCVLSISNPGKPQLSQIHFFLLLLTNGTGFQTFLSSICKELAATESEQLIRKYDFSGKVIF